MEQENKYGVGDPHSHDHSRACESASISLKSLSNAFATLMVTSVCVVSGRAPQSASARQSSSSSWICTRLSPTWHHCQCRPFNLQSKAILWRVSSMRQPTSPRRCNRKRRFLRLGGATVACTTLVMGPSRSVVGMRAAKSQSLAQRMPTRKFATATPTNLTGT
eukprot:SAG25_NODE_839_length_5126_cov_3.960016_3_plen_163_part_00